MAVAPQPKARPVPVNEAIRDRAIAHAVFLERLKTHEAQIVREQLENDVLPDLIAKLEARLKRIGARGVDISPKLTQRLRDLVEIVQESVDVWSSGLSKQLVDDATAAATQEASWQHDLLQEIVPIEWDFILPGPKFLAAAVVDNPIDGALLETIVSRLGEASKSQVERAIRLGIAEGETIEQVTSRIKKATDFITSTAEAVARTAITHASAVGRHSFYDDNVDIVKGYGWVATLDTSTCARCQELDGKTFDLDKGPRPPRHILCRCTTIPILKSMRELGLKLKDFDPSTRASMNGQVAGSVTYNAWLKGQSTAMQNEALGATRAELFRTGKVSVNDFVDRGGDPYNLDELRKREADAFKAAGL